MNKEFVSYEQALALKELGFNEPCLALYVPLKDSIYELEIGQSNPNKKKNKLVSAPTFSQAFRWFREKYGLGHMISGIGCETFLVYLINKNGIITIANAKTYEEAEQACLDKLIEIIKNEQSK